MITTEITGHVRVPSPTPPPTPTLPPAPVPADPAPDPAPDSVLAKVRLILEAFHPDEEGVALAALVRRTGLSKATVHRLSQELVAWGMLERAGSGYRLGLRLFELGQIAPRQRVLHEVALPFLEELAHTTHETVHCAVRDGAEVLYIEKLGGHRSVAQPSRTGGRMPLHCTATGRVLLAHAPSRFAEDLLTGPLHKLTGHTLTAPRLLRAELGRVRAQGFALESEETRVGYLSVAAPVRGAHHRVAGAISVTAPISRTRLDRLIPSVQLTAEWISQRLNAYELDREQR
ncbi:IclR family transcriptional regulator [Actinocorallia sp. A-T 12471]|uniref:IclR family transcriptional regulator n=1 Tax=Actinocorallia sp. A-T 12471 TaxID=3089813 RepID=UPI0029CD9A25|nr:IclR family transcriptional regulator [Actinocorallia sp. A-T 12471]MDX6742400.1 IclR family transcriptional regulator [Actinocorallia sp. A-T 12471]